MVDEDCSVAYMRHRQRHYRGASVDRDAMVAVLFQQQNLPCR